MLIIIHSNKNPTDQTIS